VAILCGVRIVLVGNKLYSIVKQRSGMEGSSLMRCQLCCI